MRTTDVPRPTRPVSQLRPYLHCAHLCAVAALATACRTTAEEPVWGRFRGPNGSGTAAGPTGDEPPIPDELSPGSAAWRTPLPPGYSSPVLDAERVFVTGAEGEELATYCLDRDTGEVLWRAAAPAPLEEPHPGPNSPVSPTPATDGENVYVFFESFGLVSYDGAGNERWRHALGPFGTPYGMGASPVLHRDTLLMLCDQDVGSFLLALDKDDGSVRWRAERRGATHGFSTPVVYEPMGGPAEVVVSGSYRVTGYSLASGAELWWVTGMAWQAKSVPTFHGDTLLVHSWMASPSELGVKKVALGWDEVLERDADGSGTLDEEEVADLGFNRLWFLYDLNRDGSLDETEWGSILARSTARNGLVAIRLGGRGDVTETHSLWRHERALPNIPSPLVYDDVVYLIKGGGILSALDPESGEVLKSGRVAGAEDDYFASPVAGGGRLLTASHAGLVAVLEAGRDWSVLSVSDFGEEIWATPALGNGQVLLRTQDALYCFGSRT